MDEPTKIAREPRTGDLIDERALLIARIMKLAGIALLGVAGLILIIHLQDIKFW